VRFTDVTPEGGVNSCTFDEGENVITTGDAANADELAANEHHTATPTSAPTHASARLATIPKPHNHIADNPRR
jgi:hypothetical protein